MQAAILAVGTQIFFQLSSSDADKIASALDGGKRLSESLKNLPKRHIVLKTGSERWQEVAVSEVAEVRNDFADLYRRIRQRWGKPLQKSSRKSGRASSRLSSNKPQQQEDSSMTGNRRSGIVLQPRDHRLLTALGKMRLIDREMAKAVAGFQSTTRANTRLLKLTRLGLLHRFFVGTVRAGLKAYMRFPRREQQSHTFRSRESSGNAIGP